MEGLLLCELFKGGTEVARGTSDRRSSLDVGGANLKRALEETFLVPLYHTRSATRLLIRTLIGPGLLERRIGMDRIRNTLSFLEIKNNCNSIN